MLLHAVNSAAAFKRRSFCKQSGGEEGGSCGLSRCAFPYRNLIIKAQHPRKDQLTPSFASTHACRPLKNVISRRIVTLSLKRTIFAAAINQHGEPSIQGTAMVHTLAMVSSESAELKGLGGDPGSTNRNTSLDSTRLPNRNILGSEQHDSAAIGSKKFIERLTDFKTWWKTVHDVYKDDSATWGYGASAIFTVYLGPSDEIERVVVDEEEIQRRQGADGLIPGLDKGGNKEQAQQNIVLARSIAKDLESGKKDFSRHSTVFAVVQHSSKYENLTARQKLVKQIDVAVHRAAPIVKWTMMIAIPLYGIFILSGAYLLVTKRSEMDLINEEKSGARLEKIRNLKAQMSTPKGNISAEQPSFAPSEFMEKLLEVREMARKVREKEGAQKLVEDSDSKLEEYRPEILRSPVASTSSIEGDIGTELEVNFSTDTEEYPSEVQSFSDTTRGKVDQPTLEDVKMTQTSANDTCKPRSSVRPRIITSLDEAMAILGSRDDSGSTEIGIYNGKPHSDHNGSKLHGETLVSNSPHSISSPLKNCEEISQVEADRISMFNSGEELIENQSMESCKGEVLLNDLSSRLYQSHDAESKEQLSEVLASERRSSRLSENGQLDEIQVSLVTHGDQVEQLHNEHKFDKVFADAVSSTCSDKVRTHDTVSRPVLSMEPDEVVGSGQPLHKKGGNGQPVQRGSIFSNTKRWSKEIQRKYDLERDPEIRELMKEIGSELESWVTEEEIEETIKLVEKLEEGDDEYVRRNYKRAHKKIKEEKERFGLDAVLEKYKEFQPKAADELWWLDLRCVLCLMVANKEGEGLYGLDVTMDDEEISGQGARHVVGFEDRKDALNFCHLLELRSSSRFQFAEVRPFSAKKLLQVSKEEGFRVTVLRSGQIQTHIDQTLEEVEDKILEIGRSVYMDKLDRDHSIDIDSMLHQRFGL